VSALGRILIVDDEALVRDVLSEYFTTQGYAVEAVQSGSDALASLGRLRPDLVLLDVRMPGIDGVEILRRIRDADDSIAVIMVTANEDVALARETLKLGAFDYVAKPFDFSYLDRAVAAALMQADSFESAPSDGPFAGGDPWRGVALEVFRAARAMTDGARQSTGARMEAAVLAAARDALAGRPAAAGQHLDELTLLTGIATALGDLPAADRGRVEAALDTARRSLTSSR
jgi:DNA-binding response OmpR family regulator